MECPYCGTKNLVDAKFCENCGRPLSSDLPAYMFKTDDTVWDKIKEIKNKLQGAVTQQNYKEVLSDKNNTITNMLIVFSAWLMLRTVGMIPFLIIVRIISFLMGYFGLIFLMSMTYVYTKHKPEILDKVEELREVDYKKTLKDLIDSTVSGIEKIEEKFAPPAEEKKEEIKEENKTENKENKE